jgi:hypothetical protein
MPALGSGHPSARPESDQEHDQRNHEQQPEQIVHERPATDGEQHENDDEYEEKR